jgi:hypothetical protein
MKAGDFEDSSVSEILHFVQGVGWLNKRVKGLQSSTMVEMHRRRRRRRRHHHHNYSTSTKLYALSD